MPASIAPKSAEKRPNVKLGSKGKLYAPQRIVGRGAFGIAYLVVKRDNPTSSFVMKRIELGHMQAKERNEAQNECKILSQLARGPYIVHVVEHFVELDRLWIISAHKTCMPFDGSPLPTTLPSHRSGVR